MKEFIIISIFVLFEIVYNLDITVTKFEEKDNEVGIKGTAILSTDFIDEKNIFDKADIDVSTIFSTEVLDTEKNKYKINCRLWKAEEIKFKIFCDFDETIPQGEYSINLNETKFNYKKNEINIISESDLTIKKLDKNITKLYSDVQVLNIKRDTTTYNLKFKIISYNQEKLYFMKDSIYTYLDKCSASKKEITCPITKGKLEEIMSKNEEKFTIKFLDDDYNFNELKLILDIKVIHNYIIKKDIYVGITKLLVNCAESNTLIAYQTNVTSISKVYTSTDSFTLNFGGEKTNCGFRKYEENPLLMVCWGPKKTSSLDEITEEIVLKNINIKYNFRIRPVKNDEIITIDSLKSGSFIESRYPDILDFRKSESLTVFFFMKEANALDGITLNENSTDLECENVNKILKKCTVNKDHFFQNINQLYFSKHKNHLNGKSVSYEVPPIKVILETSYTTFIVVLFIICLIVGLLVLAFVIMHIRGKKPNFEIEKFDKSNPKHIPLVESE